MKLRLKNKLKILLLASLSLCFFYAQNAKAGEIFFGTNNKSVGIGQTFEVGVFLNTSTENLNTISGNITFETSDLAVEDILDGNSIVNIWLEKPEIDQKNPGTILFSGIIPGGYLGKDGYLFSIIFKAQKTTKTEIKAINELFLLNDGLGTKAKVYHAPLAIEIIKENSGGEFIYDEDKIKPELFVPEITRDPNLFDNQYFLAFIADDKQSGIDYFEVKEGFWGKLIKAESPFILKDQKLTSKIKVKAVDRSGNAQIVTLHAENLGYKTIIFSSILILIVGFILYRVLKSKKHGKIF